MNLIIFVNVATSMISVSKKSDPVQISVTSQSKPTLIFETSNDMIMKCSFKELNSFSRDLHAEYVENSAREINHVMVLTDFDPDGEQGTGTSFIYYDNEAGTVTKFDPTKDTNYQLYKSAGHVLLALNSLSYADSGLLPSIQREKLLALRQYCYDYLGDGVPIKIRENFNETVQLIDEALEKNSFTSDDFRSFNAKTISTQIDFIKSR